jgi:hypothetical protein
VIYYDTGTNRVHRPTGAYPGEVTCGAFVGGWLPAPNVELLAGSLERMAAIDGDQVAVPVVCLACFPDGAAVGPAPVAPPPGFSPSVWAGLLEENRQERAALKRAEDDAAAKRQDEAVNRVTAYTLRHPGVQLHSLGEFFANPEVLLPPTPAA